MAKYFFLLIGIWSLHSYTLACDSEEIILDEYSAFYSNEIANDKFRLHSDLGFPEIQSRVAKDLKILLALLSSLNDQSATSDLKFAKKELEFCDSIQRAALTMSAEKIIEYWQKIKSN